MRRLICILLLAVMAVPAIAGTNPGRLVLLSVKQSDNPWSDNRLFERLQTALTRDQNWRVESIPSYEPQASRPDQWPSADSIIALGRDLGGQYAVCLAVYDQRIERRKSFHVPLIFHKWEAVGVMKGEFRVIDLLRGKQVKTETFEIELHGPRVLQATMDDTKFDPDITMTVSEKALMFEGLEEKLVSELLPKIKPVLAKGERDQLARQDTKKRP
jgi:hypothetical protein